MPDLYAQFHMAEGYVAEAILPKSWMDRPQRGCGVIRHDQTEVLAPNASGEVVYRGERFQCYDVKIQKSSGRESHLEVVLVQGKNREIRRLFKPLGYEVTRLRRIQYGPFKLEGLLSGAWREIPIADVRKLLKL